MGWWLGFYTLSCVSFTIRCNYFSHIHTLRCSCYYCRSIINIVTSDDGAIVDYLLRSQTLSPLCVYWHVVGNKTLALLCRYPTKTCIVTADDDTIVINTLRPSENDRHFPDDILKCIFLTENVQISTKISLKFVPKGPINNILALAQIMTWRRPGDKPLSETILASFLTHICVTRLQWVNLLET